MSRKDKILIALGIALLISLSTNLIFFITFPREIDPTWGSTLIVATSSGPSTLELVDSWDSASNQVLEQVVETLFAYDLHNPNLPRVNLLAESYYWKNKTTLQIKLREGISFHDGTPFNAAAAKWNLDRLQYLINATGMNSGEVAHTRSLWMRSDGITPIINEIETNGEFNITITLNNPYGPFLNTLSYINAGMISPTAHKSDEKSFIELSSNKLVGTGPFTYEYFNPDVEVVLFRWDSYREHVAYFERLQFKIFDSADDAHLAMLEGKVHFNFMTSDQNIATYETSQDITVKHFSDDTGIPSLIYQYLSFNNKKYNQTWRRALSYAINYSYVINELRGNNVVRSKSPISPGFGLSYNNSLIAPSYNITKAREIMISMGFGNLSWSDAQWATVAEGSPFRSIGYFSGPFYNEFRNSLREAMVDWFKLIGVELYEHDPCADDPFFSLICNPDYNKLHIYGRGWAPDYLDPYNMLEPLFNPISDNNIALVNDTKLNNMMDLALNTTNDDARYTIYKNIQGYISKECFHIPLYHSKVVWVHSKDLRNVPYNAMGKFQAYGIWKV